jgi:HPr kinase/phosphorylase
MTTLKPPQPVTVEKFYHARQKELGLRLVAGQHGLGRLIREPAVNRPGLLLAGFRRYFAEHRVQVFGNAEMHYLRSLPPAARATRYADFFATRVPCAVFCRDGKPDPEFQRQAEAAGVPVFRCPMVTMKFINRATLVLEELFAPRERVHGSMVDIRGIGVLIMGEPGVGKSECAIGLVERGYSLVADDTTLIRVNAGRELIGTSPDLGRNFMEVRGIGLVDVPAMFGVKGIRTEKRVDLIVTLKPWDPHEEIERVGDEMETKTLLGIAVPHMTIPIRPGRDVARLVEVAALHMKLRVLGYNPAKALNEALIASMQSQPGA